MERDRLFTEAALARANALAAVETGRVVLDKVCQRLEKEAGQVNAEA